MQMYIKEVKEKNFFGKNFLGIRVWVLGMGRAVAPPLGVGIGDWGYPQLDIRDAHIDQWVNDVEWLRH